jgi:sigma-B regulation protein RsbU (phosphoserine phosphatase)
MSRNPSSSPHPHARTLSLVVVNQRREITRLARLFDEFRESCGISEDESAHLHLILDEVVSNVIKHGYDDGLEHQIRVDVAVDGNHVTIRVEDDGRPFNPLDAPYPKLDLPIEQRPIGGLGVFIVKSVADSVDYRRDGGRNVVTVRKKIVR